MFKDRTDAGQQLAKALMSYKDANPIIIALPRGGVPVAYEIAKTLAADLDVLIVRKVGAPWNPEFGVGAVAENILIFDPDSLRIAGLTPDQLTSVVDRERNELQRRSLLYRGHKPFPDLKDRTVILVDDGIATGITTKAAIQAIREKSPARLILAVPVGPAETMQELKSQVDELICLHTPANFMAVGAFYDWFPQVSDNEVIDLLRRL